jgi:hypothetical protein
LADRRLPGNATRRVPGVYAIIDAGDGILATFQEEPWPELQLPGGGIDPGESPQVALAREVMEETGYVIHGIRRLGMFHRFTYMPEYDLTRRSSVTSTPPASVRAGRSPRNRAQRRLPAVGRGERTSCRLGRSAFRDAMAAARLAQGRAALARGRRIRPGARTSSGKSDPPTISSEIRGNARHHLLPPTLAQCLCGRADQPRLLQDAATRDRHSVSPSE